MSVTPTESSTSPIVEALKNIEIKPLDEKGKAAVRSLIRPGLKYVFASAFNRFTGDKFQCFRNWQERSGKALWQSVNDAFSPIINEKLQQIKVDTPATLDGVKGGLIEYAEDKLNFLNQSWVEKGINFAFEKTGVNQSIEVAKTFVEIACDLLSHTEEGVLQQTVTRLLTIVGVLYSGNEDFKANIDELKNSLLHEFFKQDGILSHILKKELGKKLSHPEKIVNLVEKLVVSLHIRNFADDFLTHTLLSKKSSTDVLKNGDVYEKLILKGVSIFVEIKEAKDLSLDELLEDKEFSGRLRRKILELQDLCKDSKLTQTVLRGENSLVDKLLKHFKGEDIIHMSNDRLQAILWCIGKEYVDEGLGAVRTNAKELLDKGAEAVGTVFGTIYRKSADVVSVVKEKAPEVIENAVIDGATGIGKVLGAGVVAGMNAVEMFGNGIVFVAVKAEKVANFFKGLFGKTESGKASSEASVVSAEAKPQDEVPAVKVDVDPATAVPARKVSVRESDAPATVKDAKTEKPESKRAEVLAAEKELEEDFGEYLQALFTEESKAESPKPEIPKTVGEQNAISTSEPRSVEQKEEESTSVLNVATNIAVATCKGIWQLGKGLCRVAAAAATGVYKCVAGSSAEAEPVSEEAPKDEADVPGTEDKSMPEATSKEGAKETEKKNKESHWYNPLSWW